MLYTYMSMLCAYIIRIQVSMLHTYISAMVGVPHHPVPMSHDAQHAKEVRDTPMEEEDPAEKNQEALPRS